MKKEIMLIDGLNMFIRSYIVNPTIDSKGRPLGGCMGFLKSLQKVVRMFQPDEVVICWDGQGGSQRRKAQNKNYKEGMSYSECREFMINGKQTFFSSMSNII
jgi:5'-3' exonuclease